MRIGHCSRLIFTVHRCRRTRSIDKSYLIIDTAAYAVVLRNDKISSNNTKLRKMNAKISGSVRSSTNRLPFIFRRRSTIIQNSTDREFEKTKIRRRRRTLRYVYTMLLYTQICDIIYMHTCIVYAHMHGRNPFTVVVVVLLRRRQTLFSRVKSPHAARTQYYYYNTHAHGGI